MKRKRRFWKTPLETWNTLRRLLGETDLPACRCIEMAGAPVGRASYSIVRECRRYVTQAQWVDRKTGKLRPQICTVVCAADKIGVTTRTIRRRIKAGEVHVDRAPSHQGIHVFDESAIETLRKIGRKKPPGRRTLTPKKVIAIRALAANGSTVRQLANRYRVTPKQIRRIIRREQWK